MTSIRFWTALFIVLGISILDWAVTKLNHYTIMRYHFPPANEEEFMMELENNPPTSFVRNCLPEHRPERSNTLNFIEAVEEDHPDEEAVAAELLKKKNEPATKQMELTGFEDKQPQNTNQVYPAQNYGNPGQYQPLNQVSYPSNPQNFGRVVPQQSPLQRVLPPNYNPYVQPNVVQYGQPVGQTPAVNYPPTQFALPRTYAYQGDPRTIYR